MSGINDLHCEVFLGGSCNPTTWRADIAIPALTKLGISYYNPVSNIKFVRRTVANGLQRQ